MSNIRLTSILKLSLLSAVLAFTSNVFADPVKAAFVYIGPTGDHGWTFAHDQGAKYVKEHMGDDVVITTVESVAENSDSERTITSLARKNDIIFTTSFGYMNPTIKVAARYPDVKFEHATGYLRPTDNISTYSARFYEGRHIIGKLAGKMTKSNVIGYIASFPIPEVIRGINSAYLAAKSVNPDIQIKIVWVYTWYDPGKEADAANALIAQGADIIMQHTDSTAAMTVAEETEGVYAFGQASDMGAWGPTSQLTGIIDDWGPYYLARVQAVKDGTWTSTDTFDGIAEGMVEFAPMANMPKNLASWAERTISAIGNGYIHPFTGPINKQDGSPWLAEGETAPAYPDLLTMDFYVEGIDSKYPN